MKKKVNNFEVSDLTRRRGIARFDLGVDGLENGFAMDLSLFSPSLHTVK